MQSLKKRLPPLNALVAFEAAARHLSFTNAAVELNLSQAAVSQQVRLLEDKLGSRLFERHHRRIRLTDAGKRYQHSVQTSLRQIAAATGDLVSPRSGRRLTVAADQSIAAMLLIPRLAEFQQRHPDTAVRVIASDIEQDCLADDVDIAIIHGNGNWPGFHGTLLFNEEVVVVCSPQYLAEHPQSARLEGIASAALLSLESEQWNWMDWRTWLSRNDIYLPVQHNRLQINHYPMLIEAARGGQGLALGWRHLIDQSLEDGTLVQPVETSVKTDLGYYLVVREDKVAAERLPQFTSWVRGWITHTVASPAS